MTSLECEICMEEYDLEQRRPVVGTCGHTYCKRCVSQIEVTRCSQCRQDRAFANAPTNFAILRQLEERSRNISAPAAAQIRSPVNQSNPRLSVDEDLLPLDAVTTIIQAVATESEETKWFLKSSICLEEFNGCFKGFKRICADHKGRMPTERPLVFSQFRLSTWLPAKTILLYRQDAKLLEFELDESSKSLFIRELSNPTKWKLHFYADCLKARFK